MQFTSILSAIVLAAPILAQKSCLGIDGTLVANDPTQPCALTANILVDDSTIATCGPGGSTSVLGPWTGVCTAGHSVVVSMRATTATYTNSSGSFIELLTLSDPDIFETCHVAGTTAFASFRSTPNCL
jgi:hypothetical protein